MISASVIIDSESRPTAVIRLTVRSIHTSPCGGLGESWGGFMVWIHFTWLTEHIKPLTAGHQHTLNTNHQS